jgi:NADPH-dependent curcumin reductase CurA
MEQGRPSEHRIDRAAQWVLARRVENGLPDDRTFRKEPRTLPPLGLGQILVRTTHISMDPHTAGEIGPKPEGVTAKAQQEVLPPTEVGAPIPGFALGEVLESRDPTIAAGEAVQGYWGWQTHAVARLTPTGTEGVASSTEQILGDENVVSRVSNDVRPVSAALHVLGEMGLAGYVGLTAVGRPRAGDVVFVSSAAGTVGGVVGQTAKNLGCRAVGSVGSEGKASYIVDTLGFDDAVNYNADDVERQLDAACPDGIDVYFDNVGGHVSDLVIQRLRPRARVVVCGVTAEWTASGPSVGPRLYWPLLVRRARIEGFSLWDHLDKYEESYRQVAEWLRKGCLISPETIVDGFDLVPATFGDFLRGRYYGKVIVRVAPDAPR